MDAVKGVGRSRPNFSITHLLAAAKFSRAVCELERAHAGKALGDFWDDIQSNAIACVLTAVAALESYANEIFKDSEQNFAGFDQAALAKVWKTFEREETLDKFDLALLLRGRNALDQSRGPYQDVLTLTKLRNALIHFKPEWLDESAEHEKLAKKLTRAVRSPFRPLPERFFPNAWMSHGTTQWVVVSTVAFVGTFANAAGLEDKTAMFTGRLTG